MIKLFSILKLAKNKLCRFFIFYIFRLSAKIFSILLNRYYGLNDEAAIEVLKKNNLNISLASDFYSPLPAVWNLKQNIPRWFNASSLSGIEYDLGTMKKCLSRLSELFSVEYNNIPAYENIVKNNYGLGFTDLDARILYYIIRDKKPKRYLEIGAGVSTYYSWLAGNKNDGEGRKLKIIAIDPYLTVALKKVENIDIFEKEVQDIDLGYFECLEAGDILSIDSSHILKIDGDVAYIFLEIIPRLKKGVFLHIHDIPFPYNVPFPPELWIFGQKWPVFWNEAMLLQAFLSFNNTYKIFFSAPLIRYFDENYLKYAISNYGDCVKGQNLFSSIWIEKVG